MSVLNSKIERRKTGGLSDEDLWQAFSAGDDSAYTLLYFRLSDKLYAYLKMVLGTGQDRLLIDDIFQDTWVRVYRERGNFESRGKGSFTGWLFRIAHNFAVSVLRRPHLFSSLDEMQENSVVPESFAISPSEPLTDNHSVEEVMVMLREVVDTLPLMFKEVYVLSEFEQMDMDQIATVLGITKANVKVRLFRSRKMVRGRLLQVLEIEGKDPDENEDEQE
jgi:RNA polymerase sigma factor (sigma-70 family)